MWSHIVTELLKKCINKSLNMVAIPYGRTHGVYEIMVRGEKIHAMRDQLRVEYTCRDFVCKVVIKENNRVECECQKSQLIGILCSYFIAVVREIKFDENLFVNLLYSMQNMAQTWSVCFELKGNQCDWPRYDSPRIILVWRLIKKERR